MLGPKRLWRTVVITSMLAVSASLGTAQDEQKEEHFFGNIASGGARAVQVVISAHSTPSDRARLLGALETEGQEAMMKILETLPKVGWVRVQGGNYPSNELHYAFETKTSDGKRHIIALTPRPVTLAEARSNNQSLDYSLSMIELFVPADGKKGDGAVVAGAEVEIDAKTKRFKMTAYQGTPTKLLNVYSK